MVSYSHVGAKDVIKSFIWRELRKDIEDMLTKSRIDTLEKGYSLIDSPCNAKMEAQLMNGDPAAAATTLLTHFKKTHKGDGMLRFCKFLRDEAKEAGGSAVLEDLADRIERAVKDLGPPQGISFSMYIVYRIFCYGTTTLQSSECRSPCWDPSSSFQRFHHCLVFH